MKSIALSVLAPDRAGPPSESRCEKGMRGVEEATTGDLRRIRSGGDTGVCVYIAMI